MSKIGRLSPITITPRPLNERLWLLVEKDAAGTLTSLERIELDCLCAALESGCASLESGQDNGETK